MIYQQLSLRLKQMDLVSAMVWMIAVLILNKGCDLFKSPLIYQGSISNLCTMCSDFFKQMSTIFKVFKLLPIIRTFNQ